MNYTIKGNAISFPGGKTATFDFPVKEAVECAGVFAVILDVPQDRIMTENVFGVSAEGVLLWQIERVSETASNTVNCYMNITACEGNAVRVGNWNGWDVDIDIKSGRVLKKTWVK